MTTLSILLKAFSHLIINSCLLERPAVLIWFLSFLVGKSLDSVTSLTAINYITHPNEIKNIVV